MILLDQKHPKTSSYRGRIWCYTGLPESATVKELPKVIINS